MSQFVQTDFVNEPTLDISLFSNDPATNPQSNPPTIDPQSNSPTTNPQSNPPSSTICKSKPLELNNKFINGNILASGDINSNDVPNSLIYGNMTIRDKKIINYKKSDNKCNIGTADIIGTYPVIVKNAKKTDQINKCKIDCSNNSNCAGVYIDNKKNCFTMNKSCINTNPPVNNLNDYHYKSTLNHRLLKSFMVTSNGCNNQSIASFDNFLSALVACENNNNCIGVTRVGGDNTDPNSSKMHYLHSSKCVPGNSSIPNSLFWEKIK